MCFLGVLPNNPVDEQVPEEPRAFKSCVLVEVAGSTPASMYRVSINYRRILQNNIFTSTEQKYMMLLPFERGMFAVS
jgi:hypothetical protein